MPENDGAGTREKRLTRDALGIRLVIAGALVAMCGIALNLGKDSLPPLVVSILGWLFGVVFIGVKQTYEDGSWDSTPASPA